MKCPAKPRLALLSFGLLLAGCASAPVHYYTLVAPAEDTQAPATDTTALPFELLPVGIPAQVDQPQLVVREGEQELVVLGSERWIAPLGDEVRSALSADLARELHSQDLSGLPGNGQPMLRIKMDLHRFDSQPAAQALIEAAWSVRLLHGAQPAAVSCTTQVSEPVGAGYAALVQGHQQAIARLAAQIAAVGRSLGAGQAPTCPLK